MGFNLHAEKAAELTSTYMYIREQQKAFIAEAQPGYTQLSKSVENRAFPIAKVFRGMLENMPDYISPDEVEYLKVNHPVPKLFVGAFQDESRKIIGFELDKLPVPPEYTSFEEQATWRDGLNALQEIATERLRKDILDNVMKGEPILRKVMGTYPKMFSNAYDKNHFIARAKDTIEQCFGEESLRFERQLVRAMLVGDYTGVNEMLDRVTRGRYSFDTFAYSAAVMDENENEDEGEGMEFGAVMPEYPGVINTVLTLELMNTIFAILDFYTLRDVPDGDVHEVLFATTLAACGAYATRSFQRYYLIVMHEICHYLTMNETHIGLYRVPLEAVNHG